MMDAEHNVPHRLLGMDTGEGEGRAEERSEERSGLVLLLDRVILSLMVAIVLAMSWPVGMVFYGQTRPVPAQVAVRRETERRETPPPGRQSPTESGSYHERSTDSGDRRVRT